MPNPSYTYIYIKYIWFGLVWFYGISTLIDYLIPNPVYIYIYIYPDIWFVNEYFVGNILNKTDLICLHTVKWFQVLVCYTINSV